MPALLFQSTSPAAFGAALGDHVIPKSFLRRHVFFQYTHRLSLSISCQSLRFPTPHHPVTDRFSFKAARDELG